MRPALLLLLCSVLWSLCASSFAGSSGPQRFQAQSWTNGLHLFAGVGGNTSTYHSASERIDWGLGVNLKTDLGYHFNERWALEWSSLIKFTRVNGYLVWDTLISWGIRYKFTSGPSSCLYGRAFGGRSPTLIKFEGSPPEEFQSQGVDRIRLDGPAFGMAFGRMMSSENRTWFVEVIGSYQDVKRVEGIQIRHEVPEVHFHHSLSEHSRIFSLALSVGLYVF